MNNTSKDLDVRKMPCLAAGGRGGAASRGVEVEPGSGVGLGRPGLACSCSDFNLQAVRSHGMF